MRRGPDPWVHPEYRAAPALPLDQVERVREAVVSGVSPITTTPCSSKARALAWSLLLGVLIATISDAVPPLAVGGGHGAVVDAILGEQPFAASRLR